MRIFWTVMIGLFFLSNVSAQMHNGQFGNEWIQYNQTYFKFNINKDGFYAIDNAVLTQAIPNLNQIAPEDFQLFCMGKAVPVYVEVSNGKIESIKFYGEKNRGALDVNLYRNPSHHFNPDYSLITDEATYFLTWSNQTTPQQYQDQSTNFVALPPKETFFWYTSTNTLSSDWNPGAYINVAGTKLHKATYEYGEGYGGKPLTNQSVNVKTPFANTTVNTPAQVTVRGFTTKSPIPHQLELSVGNTNKVYPAFNKDSVYNLTLDIDPSNLMAINTIKLTGLMGNDDQHILSKLSINYPRQFNFGGADLFKFTIGSSTQKKYLEIQNFDGGALNQQHVFLYDLTNHLRIQCFWDGSIIRTVLPPSNKKRTLVLVNEQTTKSILTLKSATFKNYTNSHGNYLVITHPNLRQDSQGNDPIFDYCAYRATTGLQPSIHTINELYDQFSYGIKGHPMAIKNFVAYIKQHWTAPTPEYLFIIGKGRIYKDIRQQGSYDHFIPTFGSPPSDNGLVAPIQSDIPMIPVGRLAATSGDEVRLYLNKIQSLEKNAASSTDYTNQSWRKNIIHLSGGSSTNEKALFQHYLHDIEQNVYQGQSGSKVYSFSQNNMTHTTTPNSAMIDSLINNGVTMISFFGHGSMTDFDYYLNTADHYKNKDKYPLILAMGCYNGTIYESGCLMSEQFVFTEEAGASSYISFVNAVAAHAAHGIGDHFYRHCHGDLYGAGIGTIVQKTIEDLQNNPAGYTPFLELANHYLVLHGDPALRLHYKHSPDYYIAPTTIQSTPKQIDNQQQEFNILVDVYNWGNHIDTILQLEVIRQHPFGRTDTTVVDVPAPQNKTQVTLRFPINGFEDLGNNLFSFHIDAKNHINELPTVDAENNNIVPYYMVQVGDIIATPIFPKEFAIVETPTIELKASTTNAFNSMVAWTIEIDTTNKFNSPLRVQNSGTSTSNVIRTTPNLTLEHEQVYYWRVRVEHNSWVESSFVYLSNSNQQGDGWNQSHLYQYERNDFEQLQLTNNTVHPFEFMPSAYEISATSRLINHPSQGNQIALYQNGSQIDKCRCSHKNGVYVAVFNPKTLKFWDMATNNYGATNCNTPSYSYMFLFETNTASGLQNLTTFITQNIPDEHWVLVYTLNNSNGTVWPANLTNYLKSQGATTIDQFTTHTNPIPYILSFQKGVANTMQEILAGTTTDAIELHATLEQAWDEGSMVSPLIGPVEKWNSLEWQSHALETPSDDITSIDIFGINEQGQQHLLYSGLQNTTFPLTNVDAAVYPYLQLRFNSSDATTKTPAQLDYWRVWSNGYNDLALTVNQDYTTTYDSITQEDVLNLTLSVENFGGQIVTDAQLQIITVGHDTLLFTIPSIAAYGTNSIDIQVPATGLSGQQLLVAHLLPIPNETNSNNNWGWLEFYVQPDDLDVSIRPLEAAVSAVQNLMNYPNPFSEQTTISFELLGELPSMFNLEIYDQKGSLIYTAQYTASEYNEWSWNGKHQNGMELPAGVYYARITVENITQLLMLIKI